MSINQQSSSISLPVKEKKKNSGKVSSVFQKNIVTKESTIVPEKPKPEFKKSHKHMEIKHINDDPKKESPFLKLLKERQAGIKPPPPVSTETAFRSDTPIEGFGQKILLTQGWEPGLKIGEKYVQKQKKHSHHHHIQNPQNEEWKKDAIF